MVTMCVISMIYESIVSEDLKTTHSSHNVHSLQCVLSFKKNTTLKTLNIRSSAQQINAKTRYDDPSLYVYDGMETKTTTGMASCDLDGWKSVAFCFRPLTVLSLPRHQSLSPHPQSLKQHIQMTGCNNSLPFKENI